MSADKTTAAWWRDTTGRDRRVVHVWDYRVSDGRLLVGIDLADGGARVEPATAITVQAVSEIEWSTP